MEKMSKIIIISIAAIIILAAIIYLLFSLTNIRSTCMIDSPLFCSQPRFGTEGFLLTIGNSYTKTIYIQDISFSQKGKETCRYLRPEIKNLSKDYYEEIGPNEAKTFFTSIEHPDGACLMKNMIEGKYYDFDIEVTCFINNERKIVKGKGHVFYSNNTIENFLFK
jgi:hypothetical protein